MTRPSCSARPKAHLRHRLDAAPRWLALLFVVLVMPVASAHAQGNSPDPAALRSQLERRFDVLPLREGVVLRPRTTSTVRSIEITRGAIAIDGQPVTGAELRTRLGGDADLVLQLSYLDDDRRRALFASGTPAAPTSPSTPNPPPSPDATAAPAPPPAPDATLAEPPQPPRPPRPSRRDRRGDRVRFGGSLTVDEDETVAGDVVVIGGSADVRGQVTGDAVVVGGSLHLGPQSEVGKDAVVVGGSLRREPGSQVHGEVEEVAVGPININWGWPSWPGGSWGGNAWSPVFSLVATAVRVSVWALLAALVVLFARDYTDEVTARAVAEPLKAGAVGLLVQALFVPVVVIATVLFAVTIIGIPLLLLIPFAILGMAVLALVGFTAVAAHVGRLITARLGWTEHGHVATTVIGVVAIMTPVLVARLVGIAGGPFWIISTTLLALGYFVEYLAWTVGMGAVALTRFSRGWTGSSVAGPVGPAGPTTTGSFGPPSDGVSRA